MLDRIELATDKKVLRVEVEQSGSAVYLLDTVGRIILFLGPKGVKRYEGVPEILGLPLDSQGRVVDVDASEAAPVGVPVEACEPIAKWLKNNVPDTYKLCLSPNEARVFLAACEAARQNTVATAAGPDAGPEKRKLREAVAPLIYAARLWRDKARNVMADTPLTDIDAAIAAFDEAKGGGA